MFKFLICFLSFLCLISADTPANCTYEDAVGTWQLFFGDIAKDCSTSKMTLSKKLTLRYPNLVEDEFGNFGTWTLIYNQGFEAVVNNFKYFGFFDYKIINSTYSISYCDRLQPMWFQDVLMRQWRCFKALKTKSSVAKPQLFISSNIFSLNAIRYGSQKDIVTSINNRNIGWKAHDYEEFHERTLYELVNMAGGLNSKLLRPKTAPITKEMVDSVRHLPKSFDWRNINGANFVSPVRNQGNCGSCYSFASAGLLEAKIRIRSNNTLSPVLSPQDVLDCSPYSQGCDGGFPYLIAGKYAEVFGMAIESCNPYKGINGKCNAVKDCQRYYATKYHYVGDFYGGSNEVLMMKELVENGPVAVGFEVYNDFIAYKGGVYHHDFNSHKLLSGRFGFNPFELTNHAVLVVGYGETNVGEKFWIVKNSWGSNWGENGFFKIRRGNDECGIESLAVATEPIL